MEVTKQMSYNISEEVDRILDSFISSSQNKLVDTIIESFTLVLTEEDYQEFFRSMMKKWGIKSPNELDDEKKKKFFDNVSKEWKSRKNEK